MKNTLNVAVVIVIGSLLGTVISKLCNVWFPIGQINTLINTGINTGLQPTTLDLNLIEFTVGLVFKFNIASIAGIFIAAVIYKQLIKP
ncbi:MAG: hypothetical protein A2X34_06210 [Elusimicrobia bacterium GWC2_51_8]|nr:MAG: hypothetical protein A2X33_02955 [Elusimicrobia bacterium GWA2_51_34]OGR59310.1 MAG: hypothetical protein A2X34_06210 [Elusimicrobia bacterium GWC2_51_8]OGR86577.1 MAG: hypothetical protein A2021_06265 [Elusimicrobia bacterium GWF2_52_66]HAF95640.1 hypothetical protein [Elusimicrobiota bacterium]HCE97669.1 hypothetical protein [Elusimicrobiota bacterium]